MVDSAIEGRGRLEQEIRMSPEQRTRELMAQIQDLAYENGVSREMFTTVRDAMLNATVVARVRDDSERGYGYDFVPDFPVRLTATRLMAELTGMIGTGTKVNVSVNQDNRVQISVDQRIAELESLGIPSEQVAAEIESTARAYREQLAARPRESGSKLTA